MVNRLFIVVSIFILFYRSTHQKCSAFHFHHFELNTVYVENACAMFNQPIQCLPPDGFVITVEYLLELFPAFILPFFRVELFSRFKQLAAMQAFILCKQTTA